MTFEDVFAPDGMLRTGKEPVLEGSIVRDSGTVWQQQLLARRATSRPSSTAIGSIEVSFDEVPHHATTVMAGILLAELAWAEPGRPTPADSSLTARQV